MAAVPKLRKIYEKTKITTFDLYRCIREASNKPETQDKGNYAHWLSRFRRDAQNPTWDYTESTKKGGRPRRLAWVSVEDFVSYLQSHCPWLTENKREEALKKVGDILRNGFSTLKEKMQRVHEVLKSLRHNNKTEQQPFTQIRTEQASEQVAQKTAETEDDKANSVFKKSQEEVLEMVTRQSETEEGVEKLLRIAKNLRETKETVKCEFATKILKALEKLGHYEEDITGLNRLFTYEQPPCY